MKVDVMVSQNGERVKVKVKANISGLSEEVSPGVQNPLGGRHTGRLNKTCVEVSLYGIPIYSSLL